MVLGVNDRDQEAARAWVEKEALPFPILQDPGRSIALAYGMSNEGDQQYLANPAGGRRPAVVIDEQGVVLKLMPDLATVEQQQEFLAGLA